MLLKTSRWKSLSRVRYSVVCHACD